MSDRTQMGGTEKAGILGTKHVGAKKDLGPLRGRVRRLM